VHFPAFCPTVLKGLPEKRIASRTINMLNTCHLMARAGKWWLNSTNKPAQ
jgi:hypothetical protein